MTYRPKPYSPKPEDLEKNLEWMERIKQEKADQETKIERPDRGFVARAATCLGLKKEKER